MLYLKPFSELGKNDASIAGGKGASLGEMTQAGIPVPPGFVILADAFEHFITKTDLVQEIEAILGEVRHTEIHTVEKASESIQALILSREMPEDIKKEIESSFTELGAQYVAVRSSATAEDGTDHAWAGQLESYLNTTEADLLERVKRCWASLFTPRAIFYRFEKGLHTHKISVAVVVQKMVASEISGIAFSVHPVTEDRNQIIIEAGYGLGEAIVSGQITPDSYVIEKTPRKIIDVNVSTQTRGLYRIEGGGNEWQTIPEPKASSQVLTEAQIFEFADLVLKIENHYGFPCDIEWAYEAGEFYIVQSRPITTLSKDSDTRINENLISTEKSEATYVLTFESKGTKFLFESLVFNHYFRVQQRQCFVYSKDSHMREYTSSDSLRLMEKEGLSRTPELTKNTIARLYEDISFAFSNPSIETLGKVLETYAYLDYAYWDILFTQQSASMNESIEFVQQSKNLIREEINKLFFGSSSFLQRLEDKISAESGVQSGELDWYSEEEIMNLIVSGKKVESVVIQARQKSFVFAIDINEVILILTGSEADSYARLHVPVVQSTRDHFRGKTAHGSGVHVGKVTLITTDYSDNPEITKRQIADMSQGSILVSENTDPSLVEAFHKAKAVVTDIGGLLSHAAITSREFNIPCVIGVGQISKIVKTGDLVEVDANSGVVRILERAENATNYNEASIPLRKEDTVFTFGSAGTAFVFEEIVSRMYTQWECIRICKDGNAKVFVAKREIERMHQEGGAMTRGFLETKVQGMISQSEYLENNIQELRNRRSFDLEGLREFFKPLEAICRDYSFFDIHYTDGMLEGDAFTDAGEYVKSIKNILRDVLGKPFFSEEGWLKTGLIVLSKQFSIPVTILEWYTKNELMHLFEGRLLSEEEVSDRKRANTIYRDSEGRLTILEGEQALFYWKTFDDVSTDHDELKGIVVHRGDGSVTGSVRIIKKDFSNPDVLVRANSDMNEGDIVVTDTTDPDFVPLMKKAAAIVTDIGGMLSHASITSRELNKLCVVGTERGSKILKDGDLVEVDADSGVVRIIERAR